VQRLDGSAPRVLTPAMQYVDGFSWSPDSRELAYSAAPRSGFTSQYETHLYSIAVEGGTARSIVDRKGINNGPRYSPDGQWVAFTTTDGKTDIMASRSLAVVPARGGSAHTFVMDDAWVNEYVWARDSKSIYFEANDGTFSRGEHMFDQPIARVWVGDGHAERLAPGQPGACAP